MWIQLGWFLLAIILLPIAIVFGLPLIFMGLAFDGPFRELKDECCGSCSKFLFCILVGLGAFILGMLCNIIFIPLFVVFGIPFIIGYMIYTRV
jgi:hypothetical protein